MRKLLTASAAMIALAGTTIAGTAPAEARGGYHGGFHGGYHGGGYYGGGFRGYRGGYHGYRGGYYGGGYALGAGLLGLAAGAAIASSARPYYYDGYYGAPAPVYYDDYGYGVCRSDWRWDGYARRYVRVRYCD